MIIVNASRQLYGLSIISQIFFFLRIWASASACCLISSSCGSLLSFLWQGFIDFLFEKNWLFKKKFRDFGNSKKKFNYFSSRIQASKFFKRKFQIFPLKLFFQKNIKKNFVKSWKEVTLFCIFKCTRGSKDPLYEPCTIRWEDFWLILWRFGVKPNPASLKIYPLLWLAGDKNQHTN